MSRPQRKRRLPFAILPRHRRGNEVIRLKEQMRRNAAMYGGRFTSHLVLNEPGRPELYDQWFQFYFAGSDRFTLWNATVITARKKFWNEISDIAHSRTAALLTEDEYLDIARLKFVPAERSSTGKILSYELDKSQERPFQQFGGRTFDEQQAKLEAQVAQDEPIEIHESFTVDRSYEYGLGLQIVVDADVINRASIEAAIDRFFSIGEVDWVAPVPVPRDRLPTVSEDEALATIPTNMR